MLNKVMLIGSLGADPEVRYTPNGETTTTISLATSRRWKDKQTGEQKESTEWHRIVFFGKLAETAGEFLKKGNQAYVEGRIQTRKWQDKNGQDRYSTEIIADEMKILGSKSGGTASFGDNSQSRYAEPQYQQPAQQYASVQPVQQYGQSPVQPFNPSSPVQPALQTKPAIPAANVYNDFDDVPF